MSGTDSALIPALRQYRHNSDAYPGFVVGYDKAETDAVITRLRAELAECKRDAELWRAHHARKQAVIDAGMARNPMRAVAANMCPHCYAIVGAPHEAWCRSTQINAALAADGENNDV